MAYYHNDLPVLSAQFSLELKQPLARAGFQYMV